MSKPLPKHLMDAAIAMARADAAAIKSFAQHTAAMGRCDAQLAPIWAEKLRSVFPGVVETLYPDLPVANGDMLPVDSVDPADLVWEYYMVDSGASMDWIDDDGSIMPSAFVKASRHTGTMAEFGGGFEYTIFELERAAKANVPLNTIKAAAVKRAHDEFVQRVWLFGDMRKGIPGLLTHPNIPASLAVAGASTSRHWSTKTGDELISDVIALVDVIAEQSIEQLHAAIVYMPFGMIRRLRSLFIGSTADGAVSFWDRLLKLYSGDDSGQGRIEFRGLNEAQASRRPTPDPLPFGGDFMLALPAADANMLSFVRARALTQRPPQEQDFKVKIASHAKIGGVKVVRPVAAHVMYFGSAPA